MTFKRLMLLGITLLILTGCASNFSAIRDYCEIYQPIKDSRHDTVITRNQVDQDNAAYVALGCQAADDDLARELRK